MPDRAYLDAHPEYAERERARLAGRDRRRTARPPERPRASRATPAVPPLYPELNRGAAVAFLEDELRMDLAQERELARLDRRIRDVDAHLEAYAARERAWRSLTMPLVFEGPSPDE